MAPEQAKPSAEGIDARVDVYALGATLANILCSRAGLQIEVKQALSHVAASLTRTGVNPAEHAPTKPALHALRKAIPKELRAIAVKAMAADREQRYESAAALGADLQRWRLGKPVLAMGGGRAYAVGCFLRRYRWASAAAAVAVLALIVGIGAALYGLGEARHAQGIAEQRRVQAEDLVGVMLGDLADKLRPLGRLDLLETVGNEAMSYLQAAAETNANSAGAVQRARALRTLGEVYVNRNQMDQASTAFARAEQALDAADESLEDPAQLLYERGNVAYWLGFLARSERNPSAAESQIRRYLGYAQALQTLTVESGLGLLETSYALNTLGTLAADGKRMEEAIALFDESVSRKRDYLQTNPEDDAVVRDLADSLSWIGAAYLGLRKPEQAADYFRQQLALLSDIAGRRPGEVSWRWDEGLAMHYLGRVELAMGLPDCTEHFQQAIVRLSSAVAADPTNMTWRESALSARIDAAWATLVMGDGGEAARAFAAISAELEQFPESLAAERLQPLRLRIAVRAAAARLWSDPDAAVTELLVEARQALSQVSEGYRRTPSGQFEQALLPLLEGAVAADQALAEQRWSEAETMIHSQLEQGEEGALQIAALIAALRQDDARLQDYEQRLRGFGYDWARARRILSNQLRG